MLLERIQSHFPHPLTDCQRNAVRGLARFFAAQNEQSVFILRGYAGTGKTSLVGALVRVMKEMKRHVVLLAPTGRAAKVFSHHAGTPAFTIHKAIYRQQTFNGEDTRFGLGYNKHQGTLFIVDEASMIATEGNGSKMFGSGSLLEDLLRFVFEADNCKIIFVGDTAQLPPVGEDESPALRAETMRYYGMEVYEADLTEVVRQDAKSGVLHNATQLRELIANEVFCLPEITGSRSGKVRFLPGNELIEALVTSYQEYGSEGTIVVTRSNKRANIYNNGIRARIFDREEELTRGDMVMVVKNNYYWTTEARRGCSPEELKEIRLPDFLANGDIMEVVRLRNIHEQYGFQFADATLRLPDYDDSEIDCRVLLSTLASESPSLSQEESEKLFQAVYDDYFDISSKRERMKKLREDPYYNALQLKYAYAVTCHKAQGGQWEHVYIDQGYLTEDMADISYLRWLYTAFTRTTSQVFLVNWPKEQQTLVEEEEVDAIPL